MRGTQEPLQQQSERTPTHGRTPERLRAAEGTPVPTQNQNIAHLNDLESADRKIREVESLLAREKNANQEVRNKLSSTVEEHERLRNEARSSEGKKTREFSELQDHYSRLQTKVKQKDSEMELLASKITQLEAQYSPPHPGARN